MIVSMQRPGGMGDLDPDAILSPSRDVLDSETDELLSRIAQLGRDWFDSDGNLVSQTALSRWNSFVDEVKAWDAGPRIFTHLLGTTWRDELITYQRTFNSFLNEWMHAGVNVTIPPFTFNPPPPGTLDRLIDKAEGAAKAAAKPATDLIDTIKWVAIAGGVAVVGFVFYLTFETGRTARAIGPKVLR